MPMWDTIFYLKDKYPDELKKAVKQHQERNNDKRKDKTT